MVQLPGGQLTREHGIIFTDEWGSAKAAEVRQEYRLPASTWLVPVALEEAVMYELDDEGRASHWLDATRAVEAWKVTAGRGLADRWAELCRVPGLVYGQKCCISLQDFCGSWLPVGIADEPEQVYVYLETEPRFIYKGGVDRAYEPTIPHFLEWVADSRCMVYPSGKDKKGKGTLALVNHLRDVQGGK